jgi:SNF2 family DNA or RNA helicase
LCYKPQTWLIIGSKNTMSGWQKEIKKWFPEFGADELFIMVKGTPTERHAAYMKSGLFYATTSAAFVRDIEWLKTKKVNFQVISIDEIHKIGLRNRKSAGFKSIKLLIALIERHFPKVKLINPMTGTWTSKGPAQQWPTLNLLAPKQFKSYWQHISTYCLMYKGPFGTEIIGVKNTESLAAVMSPYVYTVGEEEASKYLPPINRQRLEVNLPPELTPHYYSMLKELYFHWSSDTNSEYGEVESVATILAATMKLRQLIVCPSIIKEFLGPGPMIEAICDKILDNKELPNWRHNLIFTPFVPSLLPFKQYISDALEMPLDQILVLRGGIESEELSDVELRFRKDPNTLILSTVKYGQSWNAETALNVYFAGFEWDQDENKQCEGRSRRTDGVQKMINSYYCNIEGTITSDMLEILNRKEMMNKVTYQDIEKIKERIRAQLEGTT